MEKKKINFARREPSIPEEIIFELFSWLPAKSLLRFKCVTKFCKSLVSESDFVDIHSCHSMTRPGGTKFFLHGEGVYYNAEQKKDGKAPASVLQIERLSKLYDHAPAYPYLNCINGLFCVWESLSLRPAAIFNHGTREVRFLPVLNDSYSYNYSFGFEPEEKKFKVLLSAKPVKEGYRKYWVFTLGIDKLWRETQSISPYTPYCKPSVCASGVIYQFVTSDYESAIAAFDVKSENFEIIQFWDAIDSVYNCKLIEVKGKLAVIDYERWLSGYMDLRILEQTPRKEWEKHIIFFPSIRNCIQSGPISSSTSLDGEIVYSVDLKLGTLWCYDVITKSVRELGIKGLPKETRIKGIYGYAERLVM